MDLSGYLAKRKISATAFAAEIGVPPSTILRVMRGERDPRGALVRKIVDGSGGEVSAGDLLDGVAAARAAAATPEQSGAAA